MQMPYVTMFCSHFVMLNLFQHLSADKDKTRLAVRC
jgi:hypothetical protein